jgi:PIN domain nuclease of toxin-antitoxin system
VIVLDTHVLAWFAEDDPHLGKQAGRVADAALHGDDVAVSAISFWEIAMLAQKGRLALAEPPPVIRRKILERGIREVPMDGAIGIRAAELKNFHGDPADRIIVATAMAQLATLMTADKPILRWRGGNLKTIDARR